MMSSVASRPEGSNPMPEVMINGRPEPTNTDPKTSTTLRSFSQFSLNFEKSWLKAM
jgi:hypothetical protein